MKFEYSASLPQDIEAKVLVLPIAEDLSVIAATMEAIREATGQDLLAIATEEGFKAEPGKAFLLRGLSNIGSSRVLLVGIGTVEEVENGSLRKAGALAARKCRALKRGEVVLSALVPSLNASRAAEDFALGFALGAYKFDRYVEQKEDDFQGFEKVVMAHASDVSDGLTRAEVLSDAICWSRDLVNEPPNVLDPGTLADRSRAMAHERGMEVTILDQNDLEEKGFRLITAVGRGSSSPPRFIHIKYVPEGDIRQKVALVGKGITFDTGGYNLKPGGSILNMHSDMAGAAAALGAIRAIGTLKPPGVEVHAIVPAAENSIAGNAFRPQDIIRGYGGKTVEIHNTDAEGRLILADALAWAQEQKYDAIVDLATLTGAIVVALGEHTAGLFSDDDALATALLEASKRAGEDVWRMPLNTKLDKLLDTPNADMKNLGSRWGGAVTAALFLKRWVQTPHWAHLDIAGPSFLDKEDDLSPSGGTGFAVATLVEWVSGLSGT